MNPRDDSDESRDDSRDEDAVWRDIVANYGDSPASGELEPVEPEPAGPADAWNPEPWNPVPWEDEGTFVPPVPPPLPRPTPARGIAWAGVFGAPAILLLFLIIDLSLPSWASTLLVLWFVGGFVFLVATMKSGPRDPGDDGAVV